MVWLIVIGAGVAVFLWAQHDSRRITEHFNRERQQQDPYRLYRDMLDIDDLIKNKPR